MTALCGVGISPGHACPSPVSARQIPINRAADVYTDDAKDDKPAAARLFGSRSKSVSHVNHCSLGPVVNVREWYGGALTLPPRIVALR